MSTSFFEQISDALIGFLPAASRGVSFRTSSRNLKVWFGEESPEHFEVQLIGKTFLTRAGIRATGPMLEIGLHAEYPSATRNDAAIGRISERSWRARLGKDPVAGAFIGRKEWRRISELWEAPSDGEETAIEAAERLAQYIDAFAGQESGRARRTKR